MSLRTGVLAASGIALATAVLPGIVAAPQERPVRGARVAIAAFHDSRLFTLCPVFGKDVIESNVWMSGMKAKVTVFYPPTGGQAIGLHFDAERHARAALPMPAGSSPGGPLSQPPAFAPGELDRLARDVGVEQAAIEASNTPVFVVRFETGDAGSWLPPDADVPEMLAHIGSELSNQDVLAYSPSNATLDGSYRRIRVAVDCEGCSVRARRGYRAGAVR